MINFVFLSLVICPSNRGDEQFYVVGGKAMRKETTRKTKI
jgi:hypothetical protein